MALDSNTVVGVVGAGAMGAGIAQIAAQHGHRVVLADAFSDALDRARTSHLRAMAREIEKGRLDRAGADAVMERISYVAGTTAVDLLPMAACGLVIEAVVEQLDVKLKLFRTIESIVAPDAVVATNTSSLSVAALGAACERAGRVVGIHFFNPAPVMPLVEIIPAINTRAGIAENARALVDSWGKTTVMATDTPGFIVNRIARPFYGESLRLYEEGVADFATIDWAVRELGGYRMGPFELMDFIGNDVNYATTCSVFESMFYDPRYRPALTQRRMVEAGLLGRKTKRGYYDYREGAVNPEPLTDEKLGHKIVDRVLAMLINEAVEAVYMRVASPADIELAMTKGVNYPRGLLALGDEIGPHIILERITTLQAEYGEDRYRPSVLLRRAAKEKRSLLT
jgi:3-hydroxybutyryl-CoA dehydrogenase